MIKRSAQAISCLMLLSMLSGCGSTSPTPTFKVRESIIDRGLFDHLVDANPVNLGLVGIKSSHSRYLQSHSDNGELHASNEHRNEEETWFLVQIDPSSAVYSIYNWSNGNFLHEDNLFSSTPFAMSSPFGGCPSATRPTLSPSEEWVLVSGKHYGVLNAVAFKSLKTGNYLYARNPGNDTGCGGEVDVTSEQPSADGSWGGWWVMEPATPPEPGRDPWNIFGGYVQKMINKLTPADLEKLAAALAS